MNIFVTVGTTSFDPLIEEIDQSSFAVHSTIQIANGNYTPTAARWYRFKDNLNDDIENADIVVTHCGAGTIFSLLRSRIIPIAVPNVQRRDKHQLELAHWLEEERFAVVAMTVDSVTSALEQYNTLVMDSKPFDAENFFYHNEFNALLRNA